MVLVVLCTRCAGSALGAHGLGAFGVESRCALGEVVLVLGLVRGRYSRHAFGILGPVFWLRWGGAFDLEWRRGLPACMALSVFLCWDAWPFGAVFEQ